MAFHKIADVDPNYRFSDRDMMGFNIYSNGEIIGSVDDILVDEQGKPCYIVMFTGRFLSGKRVLLPYELAQVSMNDRHISVNGLGHEQIEALPAYDHGKHVNEQEYESQVEQVYRPLMSRADNATVDVDSTTTADIDTTTAHDMGTVNTIEQSAVVDDITTSDMNMTTARSTGNVDTVDSMEPPSTFIDNRTVADIDMTPTQDIGTASLIDQASAVVSDVPVDGQNIELYEERVVADKGREKTGEVAIGKRVETESAKASVDLEKERIVVEAVTPTDIETSVTPGSGAFQDGEIARMEAYEETPDIHKEAFVREQVNVRKEVEQDVVEADEQIRREELDLRTEGQPLLEKKLDPLPEERI
jgi:uncharacterized protein (TIGR02271 family)